MAVPEPTREQWEAIKRPGKFILRACPGSGKTFTVAMRLADRLRNWKPRHAGIATLSFTNVACAEIQATLALTGWPGGIRAPHFLGTLDSFIDTFIFLPFGHRVMGSFKRPVLVGFDGQPWSQTGAWAWGKDHGTCYQKGCTLTNFSWNLRDQFVDIRPSPPSCDLGHRVCKGMKAQFARTGYATQTDAAYWAVQVLTRYPWIAKALVRRFPAIIVDEVQDTSEAQMKVIDLLVEAGLKEVMLVGDPDQAIYEWRQALPELMRTKLELTDWGPPSALTLNQRSSQSICDVTWAFSTLGAPSKGYGEGPAPELWEFDEASPDGLLERFLAHCRNHGIDPNPETTAVLVRGSALRRRLLKLPQDDISPWDDDTPATRLLALATWMRDTKGFRDARKATKDAVTWLVCNNPSQVKLNEYVSQDEWVISIALHRLLKSLPPVTLPLEKWTSEACNCVAVWARSVDWGFQKSPETNLCLKNWVTVKGHRSKEFLDAPVASFFDTPTQSLPLTVDTIHSAKGKTYDAVMLPLSIRGKCTPKQLAEESRDAEVRRTAYVAMTRARRVLVVALSSKTKPEHRAQFEAFTLTR